MANKNPNKPPKPSKAAKKSPGMTITQASRRTEEMRAKRAEILEAAAGACDRLGGLAIISDRYTVVDTTLYSIVPKEPKR